MRQAYLEKADSQKMKQKARERMQPKMGKLDIDYQVWRWAKWGEPALLENHVCTLPALAAAAWGSAVQRRHARTLALPLHGCQQSLYPLVLSAAHFLSGSSTPAQVSSPVHMLHTHHAVLSCPPSSQVLHDAFFKYQTKPKLTAPGEMYYEGKEFEAQITHARPGALRCACCACCGVP